MDCLNSQSDCELQIDSADALKEYRNAQTDGLVT